MRPTAPSRNVTARSVSSTYDRAKPVPPDDGNCPREIKSRVAMIDSARLAADMGFERAKSSELQADHIVFWRELAATRSRRSHKSGGWWISRTNSIRLRRARLRTLKLIYGREIGREDLGEDLRLLAQDLSRERSNYSILKATVSEQSTTHVALGWNPAQVQRSENPSMVTVPIGLGCNVRESSARNPAYSVVTSPERGSGLT